jgi:primosomal protein N'
LRKSTATALYAKEKKPRFTQTAHVGGESKKKFASQKGGITSSSAVSSSSSKQQKGGPKQGGGPKQVWDSGKSIDDLESTMLKRWGSLTDNPPPDMDEFEGEDDEEALDKGVVGLAGRRAVLDPWQQQEKEEASKKEKDKSKNPMAKKKKKVFEPEFYDQDDEGYEYIPLDDDGKDAPSSKKNGKMSVAHMIAPKPAGGRGTKENDDRDGIDINADGGFFFNPQPTSQKVDEDMKREQEAQIAVKPAKRVAAVTSAQPILNDKGKPMLLTVDEAMYQFKKSIPKGAEVEYISTDDSPIIATTKTQSWSDLGITDEQLMENLRAMNCPTPLDVQDKACPPIITGNDVLVGTYTGSGKTLAFLTPLVQRLLWEEPGNDMALLVIAPGRELASQITSVARALIENTGLSVQLAIGGTTFTRNLEQIRRRKPNIIVGTPGRIAELVVGKPGEK